MCIKKKNVGATDKVIRIVVALIAAYFGWKISAWFYLIAAIALITAASGWCGLYALLGISTVEKKKAAKKGKKRRR